MSSWNWLRCFSTLPVSAVQKWFTCKLRNVTPDNFSMSNLAYVFYLPFLCTHTPLLCPVTLQTVFPLSACTSFPVPTNSIPLSLPICCICLTPLYHKKSPRLLFVFPARLSSFPFFSIFLSVSLCHALSLLLYHWNAVSLFSFISGPVCPWFVLHAHTFHTKTFYPVTLDSSCSMSLCYFPGRNVCPGAVFQRCQWRWLVQVHVRYVGPPMQEKCRTNKPWAFPVPKGLGRAFWLIYDHFDDWGDHQNEYEYVLNVENLAMMPLAF